MKVRLSGLVRNTAIFITKIMHIPVLPWETPFSGIASIVAFYFMCQ